MSRISIIKPMSGRKGILAVAAIVTCLALLLAITAGAGANTSSGSAFAQAAAVDAKDPFQWDLSVPDMPKVNQPYFLINKRNDSGVLGYKSRYLGLNLNFVPPERTGELDV